MHRPTVTTALKALFDYSVTQDLVNNGDVLVRYTPSMEVQVNVAADHGRLVPGKQNTWTDGTTEWWHIRIPKKAMTEDAYWNDYPLNWSIVDHADGIGMTGWDWERKLSKWVAFDFDSITGHAAGVGVDKQQLDLIQEAASNIPWAQVRYSTRGGGLHLYVYFSAADDLDGGIPTKTHTEHAALARAILALMTKECGFNFAASIDVCGSNMWVWHRDANKANHGLGLISDATEIITPEYLNKNYPNWLDNVEVVARTRTRVRIRGLTDDEGTAVEQLASRRPAVELTDKHEEVIDRLTESGFSTVWVHDHMLLQTHTCAFKKLMEDYPGDYQGWWETLSEGDDPGKPNCFAFPLPDRGWKVVLFGRGRTEHELWTQDGEGWTWAMFDRRPTFHQTCTAMGGNEGTDGTFQFDSLTHAITCCERLSIPTNFNWEVYRDREAFIGLKQNRVFIRVRANATNEKPENGWRYRHGRYQERFLRGGDFDIATQTVDFDQFDHRVRNVVTPNNEDAGWMTLRGDETSATKKTVWVRNSMPNTRAYIQGPMKLPRSMVDPVMGHCVARSWQLVSLPFQPEYPGGRQWNLNAPQWKHQPAAIDFGETPHHPHWDMVLDHVGEDLNEPLKTHEWAQRHGIHTGRQYLQLWIASLLREPFDKLPYLFLHGPENSGKTTLHWAISKLMTTGYNSISDALGGKTEFNSQLMNCVLGIVEEQDVSKGGALAKNRMKDWTTSDTLSIRKMRTDHFIVPNTLHFIQCSNYRSSCLAVAGDTRIIMIYVGDLSGPEIPKAVLSKHLEEEAPQFMATLVSLMLPPVEGRYRLPVVETPSKKRHEEMSTNQLERYIKEQCHFYPGKVILFKDFYEKFHKWMDDEEDQSYWSKKKVSRYMPDAYPIGRMSSGPLHSKTCIGNISFDDPGKQDLDRLTTYIRNEKGILEPR